MTKRMLIDATHDEETRVVVVDGHRLMEFDYESKVRRQLKGTIFLAKVTRVEPSLQAAFVNFGGNRHGFLPFSEIHPDYFRIPISDREALLREQMEEMEARRAAEEAEDMEEENARAGGRPVTEDEDSQEEDAVEELGGEDRVADAVGDEATPAPVEAAPADDEEEDSQPDHDPVADEGHDDEDEDEEGADMPAFSAGESADGEGEDEDNIGNRRSDEEENDVDGNREQPAGDEGGRGGRGRGRGRGGRFRGRGGRNGYGGRGGGGRRMAAGARRVEMLGGDGVEGDHPARPSLRRNYKIQEVIKRGQIMLIQVSKEERGNKGAAVTTYLSLPGRYCVLMPNSPRGGGVSRKIASFEERRRMREILAELQVPEGMSVIMRTAGMSRTKQEIKRDLDYLLKLWDGIRELTLQSTAPALIHEEGNLIRRSIRDIYSRDIEEIQVAGDEGYNLARDFMKILMPTHIKKVNHYTDEQIPLFHRYQVESQLAAMGEPSVTLKSGGYLVINPTEALVSIDVNSGRATKERHIEETALKTNLEAADEVARQLRLRDLGGLIVIDFIDMEDRRNNAKVERRLKEALSTDRARIQVGRISSFGLLELSRQRLNPSVTEAQFQRCAHCQGIGYVRTVDSAAITVLRAREEEGIRARSVEVTLSIPNEVALYILNNKRDMMENLERRYGFRVLVRIDDHVGPPGYKIDHVRGTPVQGETVERPAIAMDDDVLDEDIPAEEGEEAAPGGESEETGGDSETGGEGRAPFRREGGREGGRSRGGRNRGGRNRGGRNRHGGRSDRDDRGPAAEGAPRDENMSAGSGEPGAEGGEQSRPERSERSGRSRSRRGGRNRGGRNRSWDENRPEGGQRNDPPLSANDSGASEGYRPAPAPEQPAPVMAARREPAPAGPAPARDYETVNAAPSEKKKGWWNRLVEG